jgi:hypothetical protein
MLLKQQYSDILKTAFDSACISPNDSIAPAFHLMTRVYMSLWDHSVEKVMALPKKTLLSFLPTGKFTNKVDDDSSIKYIFLFLQQMQKFAVQVKYKTSCIHVYSRFQG